MNTCCNMMSNFICIDKNDADPDNIIIYSSKFDEYGIPINDGGTSYILISYCPWCGKKLPDSKRDKWFDEIEKMGIDDPFCDNIPDEYKTDLWWKNKD